VKRSTNESLGLSTGGTSFIWTVDREIPAGAGYNVNFGVIADGIWAHTKSGDLEIVAANSASMRDIANTT
jgi:hypothetical protein